MLKRAMGTVMRALISASILAIILLRVPTDELLGRARDAAYLELGVVVLLFVAIVALVALRWRLLAGWLGLAVPASLLVRAVFLGLFAGQVLPSSLGSDVVRGWAVARQTGRTGRVAASIVVDRLVGLCGVCLLIAFAYGFFVRQTTPLPTIVVAAAGVVTAAVVLSFLAASTGRLAQLRNAARRLFPPLGAIEDGARRPALLALALAVAVTIHGTATLAAALSAAAYGMEIRPVAWLAIIPVSALASALPVSINGWGVREGAIIALAAAQGIAPADALLVSLTLGAGNVIASLPGGLLWLRRPDGRRAL
jgi:uncharacterized membrane protein YbhN (UPF0104 family)